eukprot:TRINITY_DN22780_c0_g1_i3.p1 TRINITY_DN22780_c0_g1~~TRINITY_DN22780_c0_g1_i3.p1  ORF type:complete len:323 (-),score=21.20 TRINITY_DN22780_c0_g1_i3:63-1031(-)
MSQSTSFSFDQNNSNIIIINQSKSSAIYQICTQDNQSTGKVLKTVKHIYNNNHQRECKHLTNEFQILSQLKHPNILKVFGTFKQHFQHNNKQFCCIEMQQADIDLFSLLTGKSSEQIPLREFMRFGIQIANAINYLHEECNIAHNDIKLSNVLAKDQIAILADFGFARKQVPVSVKQQLDSWTNRSQLSLSPEILEFFKKTQTMTQQQKQSCPNCFDEKKADIFAFGILLFNCLFGQNPFERDQVSIEDPLYQFLHKKQYEKFWDHQDLQQPLSQLSKCYTESEIADMKNFFQLVLSSQPEERIDIAQVIHHPWITCQSQSK